MAADIRIKGEGKPIPHILQKPRKNQFDEVLLESERLLTGSNANAEINLPNPDLTVNLKSLSSLYLDANKKFIELKKKLEQFYLDARREHPILHPNRSHQWTKLLYQSLHKLLNECVFTSARKLQLECLDRVYDWYYEKIGKENSLQVEEEQPNGGVIREPISVFEIEDEVEQLGDAQNFDKLSHYSRRQINSANSQRPITAISTSSKWLEQRPQSTFRGAVQAFVGAGEPIKPTDDPGFESTYVTYKPLGEDAEKLMEKRFQNFRNKEVAEKRLRDEMNQKVKRWVSARAKRAEEQSRRTESFRFASKFEQRAYSPARPATSSSFNVGKASLIDFTKQIDPQIDLESEDSKLPPLVDETLPMHKLDKVNTLRKLHGDLIDARNVDEGKLIQDPSAVTLTVYPQSTSKGWYKQSDTSRPVTAGTTFPAPRSSSLRALDRPITAQTRGQIEELYEVKRRLASHNIPCSFDAMKYALLTPDDLPSEQLTVSSLPKPGAGLLLNPFIKIGKKKKKKKGKKKGKKSKKA
ncbi:unnamed protein product [Blepharisma stoltei]|uniref:Uncharacterized protein n=1 Tax=Blepharisma stoltei TaxID=1481888 RepID=A0AAU9ITY1_9CILI|nr:unnamed protein product [Blepharisma stoltei]